MPQLIQGAKQISQGSAAQLCGDLPDARPSACSDCRAPDWITQDYSVDELPFVQLEPAKRTAEEGGRSGRSRTDVTRIANWTLTDQQTLVVELGEHKSWIAHLIFMALTMSWSTSVHLLSLRRAWRQEVQRCPQAFRTLAANRHSAGGKASYTTTEHTTERVQGCSHHGTVTLTFVCAGL